MSAVMTDTPAVVCVITAMVWNESPVMTDIRSLTRGIGSVMSLLIGMMWLSKVDLSGTKREL